MIVASKVALITFVTLLSYIDSSDHKFIAQLNLKNEIIPQEQIFWEKILCRHKASNPRPSNLRTQYSEGPSTSVVSDNLTQRSQDFLLLVGLLSHGYFEFWWFSLLFAFPDRLDSEEDDVEFDPGRSLSDSIRECLKEVTTKAGKVRKARKLSYLVSISTRTHFGPF